MEFLPNHRRAASAGAQNATGARRDYVGGEGKTGNIHGDDAAGLIGVGRCAAERAADAIIGRRVAKQWTGLAPMDADEDATGRSRFLRYPTRRRGFLVASLVIGFVVGVAYRGLVDAPESRSLANYLRSGF